MRKIAIYKRTQVVYVGVLGKTDTECDLNLEKEVLQNIMDEAWTPLDNSEECIWSQIDTSFVG